MIGKQPVDQEGTRPTILKPETNIQEKIQYVRQSMGSRVSDSVRFMVTPSFEVRHLSYPRETVVTFMSEKRLFWMLLNMQVMYCKVEL